MDVASYRREDLPKLFALTRSLLIRNSYFEPDPLINEPKDSGGVHVQGQTGENAAN